MLHMQTMIGALIVLVSIGVLALGRIMVLLAGMAESLRTIEFHTRRIPVDPKD